MLSCGGRFFGFAVRKLFRATLSTLAAASFLAYLLMAMFARVRVVHWLVMRSCWAIGQLRCVLGLCDEATDSSTFCAVGFV